MHWYNVEINLFALCIFFQRYLVKYYETTLADDAHFIFSESCNK